MIKASKNKMLIKVEEQLNDSICVTLRLQGRYHKQRALVCISLAALVVSILLLYFLAKPLLR